MKLIPTLLMATAVLVGNPALAHGDADLDKQNAPNGGQMRMAGAYHFELLVARDGKEDRDSPLIVYVTDHAGVKVPTAGAAGSATILAGKVKTAVTLTPDGDNRLRGSGRYVSTPDMKVVVAITFAGKSPEQARFTPLAASGLGIR